MKNKKKTFRSRISVLILGIILAPYIFLVPSSIQLFRDELYGILYLVWVPFLFILFILGGFRYIISGNILYVKMWCIPNMSAKIEDIVSIERSYNFLSSPAGSLKRLRIDFKDDMKSLQYRPKWLHWPYWLISPVREKEFLKEIESIDPLIFINVPEEKGIWRFWDWDISIVRYKIY